MKTEEEIRDEIAATYRTIKNHKIAYQCGIITKDDLKIIKVDCESTIDALRWVLGENDRYD
jgi:hypothetical protein